jgi:hypothetical protein
MVEIKTWGISDSLRIDAVRQPTMSLIEVSRLWETQQSSNRWHLNKTPAVILTSYKFFESAFQVSNKNSFTASIDLFIFYLQITPHQSLGSRFSKESCKSRIHRCGPMWIYICKQHSLSWIRHQNWLWLQTWALRLPFSPYIKGARDRQLALSLGITSLLRIRRTFRMHLKLSPILIFNKIICWKVSPLTSFQTKCCLWSAMTDLLYRIHIQLNLCLL